MSIETEIKETFLYCIDSATESNVVVGFNCYFKIGDNYCHRKYGIRKDVIMFGNCEDILLNLCIVQAKTILP